MRDPTNPEELDSLTAQRFFRDPEELRRYRDELSASGVLEAIDDGRRWFEENVTGHTVRGNPYVLGAIPRGPAARLYALLRSLRPKRLVETGVCNGASTAVVLQALHDNGSGRLISIDWPEYAGTAEPDRPFWSGKAGAVVPAGKSPGWIVPEYLRDRWELIVGRSQDELPMVLERMGAIDFFMHDSEHSYECMMFEFEAAFAHLVAGGVLCSDDTDWNTAFDDFAAKAGRPPYHLGAGIAFIQK